MGVTICPNIKKFVIKHSDSENCSNTVDWKNESRQLKSAFYREVHTINGFCVNSYFILSKRKHEIILCNNDIFSLEISIIINVY